MPGGPAVGRDEVPVVAVDERVQLRLGPVRSEQPAGQGAERLVAHAGLHRVGPGAQLPGPFRPAGLRRPRPHVPRELQEQQGAAHPRIDLLREAAQQVMGEFGGLLVVGGGAERRRDESGPCTGRTVRVGGGLAQQQPGLARRGRVPAPHKTHCGPQHQRFGERRHSTGADHRVQHLHPVAAARPGVRRRRAHPQMRQRLRPGERQGDTGQQPLRPRRIVRGDPVQLAQQRGTDIELFVQEAEQHRPAVGRPFAQQ